MARQEKWHFCHKCSCMFFGPLPGHCVAGGEHDEQGFTFTLPFDEPATGQAQANWRFCRKCSVMFFGGNPGHCVQGAGHDGTGSFNFVLPHDMPEPPGSQRNWRFCNKCSSMFFGGNPGRCVQGAGHNPTGSFDFVLPHTAEVVEPTIFTTITLKSLSPGIGNHHLNGLTGGNHSVVLAPSVSPSGTRWRRASRGNIWVLRCLGDPPQGVVAQDLFLAGSNSGSVLIVPRDQTPGGKPETWRATQVGQDTFTLECLAPLSGPRFLEGRPGSSAVFLSNNGDPQFTRWKVEGPPIDP
ncbi:MAG: hypothetical protein WCE79_12025 [Xanthobacteraceae bacterium]